MKHAAVILVVALLLSSCGNSTYDHVEYMEDAMLLFYETTLEGLEKQASNIVIGRLYDDSHTIYREGYFDKQMPLYSAVTFEVLDVISGDLEAGTKMTIVENYYIEDRTLYTRGNYLPSIPGQEYIFFLGNQVSEYGPKGYQGAYFVIHRERGRYLVPSDKGTDIKSFSKADLSLGEKDTELYMQLYQEVIDAYIN